MGRSGIDPSPYFSDLDLSSRQTVIAAVSGGSDSTALLLLLKAHLARCAPATRLVAVTVDHGLRAGSAAEAEGVGRLCAAHRVEHRILAWRGPRPAAGLPAAARAARHDLLAEAARRERTDLVLTAHTADDQAETVLMRQARAGGRGLAGMAPATLFCRATWFVRPLLAIRRQALRDFLRQGSVQWIDDPTNEDLAYERARMRKSLGQRGGEERIEAALRTSGEAAARRMAEGESAARLICVHATQAASGLTRLDRQFARSGGEAVYAMRILLAVAGGAPHLPDAGRAAALVEGIAAGAVFRAVLSRCLVDARRAAIFLLREARGLPPAMPVEDGMVWDGRFRIACRMAGLSVVPRGPERAEKATRQETACPRSLVRAALAAEPLLLGPPPPRELPVDGEFTPTRPPPSATERKYARSSRSSRPGPAISLPSISRRRGPPPRWSAPPEFRGAFSPTQWA